MPRTIKEIEQAIRDLVERGDPNVCCCGADMDNHGDPMDAGHSPTSLYHYTMGGLRKELNDALADTPTPPPQEGTWTLTAPDGRTWTGPTPMAVVHTELRTRVPMEVAFARILREADDGQG